MKKLVLIVLIWAFTIPALAFDYPVDCTSNADRLEYANNALEALRLWNNAQIVSMTAAEQLAFKVGEWEPRLKTVIDEISKYRHAVKKSGRYAIDASKIEKTVVEKK